MANVRRTWALVVVVGFIRLYPLSCGAADDSELKEDCASFNPATITVEQIRGDWKIVDGTNWMFGFGSREEAARRALAIIQYYRMNLSCFAGRPNPPMADLLVPGRAPVGSVPGEHYLPFDATRLVLRQSDDDTWQVVAGSEVLFDFAYKRAAAELGFRVLLRHKFNQKCTVAVTDTFAGFRYLRR